MARRHAIKEETCFVCGGTGVTLDITQDMRGVQDVNTMSNTYARSVPRTDMSASQEMSILERDRHRIQRQQRAVLKQARRLQRQLGIIHRRKTELEYEMGGPAPDAADKPLGALQVPPHLARVHSEDAEVSGAWQPAPQGPQGRWQTTDVRDE